MAEVKLLLGDCLDVLPTLEAESVHCVVTSPPYFGLRDYGHEGQIGLEDSPETYVAKLVAVFREVRRVLRDDGVVWLNLGDSYAGSNKGMMADGHHIGSAKQMTNRGTILGAIGKTPTFEGIKPKDLIGIPWRVAFALQADGWYLRQDIIWHKPNPMPESVTDRCTKAHEYIFLLTKSPRYFYDADAVKEPLAESSIPRLAQDIENQVGTTRANGGAKTNGNFKAVGDPLGGRNRRSVWTVTTKPYKGAHFATFPETLVEPCILAGCPHKVCAECGAPWVRQVERTDQIDPSAKGSRFDRGKTGVNGQGRTQAGERTLTVAIGFAPTCACNGEGVTYASDDLEIINTPTGERVGDDPSLVTGRAGLNRPRGDGEGQRPITRYEQRRYAEQLRNSPHREQMESIAGSAFEHYIRTDRSGARPLPSHLLERWIVSGWLTPVELPVFTPADTRPGVVLDPFAGSGTVGAVARRLGRDAVLIELNAEYLKLAEQRVSGAQPPLIPHEATPMQNGVVELAP